jgi:hypothetical protein
MGHSGSVVHRKLHGTFCLVQGQQRLGCHAGSNLPVNPLLFSPQTWLTGHNCWPPCEANNPMPQCGTKQQYGTCGTPGTAYPE